MRKKELIEILTNKFGAIERTEHHIQIPAELGTRTWHNLYFTKAGLIRLQLYKEKFTLDGSPKWVIQRLRKWQEQYNGIIDLKPA